MKSKLWQKISLVKKKKQLRHILWESPHCLFIHCFLLLKFLGFWFQPERSISNREGFYQDSSDEGNTTEQDMFVSKDCDPSVSWMYRNCSTMKTEKECLCYHEVETVCDFNLQGIFVPSQAIILLDLAHNLKISISICFCNQTWLEPLACQR